MYVSWLPGIFVRVRECVCMSARGCTEEGVTHYTCACGCEEYKRVRVQKKILPLKKSYKFLRTS